MIIATFLKYVRYFVTSYEIFFEIKDFTFNNIKSLINQVVAVTFECEISVKSPLKSKISYSNKFKEDLTFKLFYHLFGTPLGFFIGDDYRYF